MKKLNTLNLLFAITVMIAALIPLNSQAKIVEIFDTQTQKIININELMKATPQIAHFIFGEFHNMPEIQKAHAQLIEAKVNHSSSVSNFTLHWEFVDYTDRNDTQKTFRRFINNEITSTEFVTKTAGKQNLAYTPIFDSVKKLNGRFRGINLPREIKQKVIAQGTQSVDPIYIPFNHYVGGPEYLERFKLAMGSHVPAEKLPKYFEAQCLTDSVMAEQISIDKQYNGLNFVIAGSFHTDFFDATVVRLRKLITNPIITFKTVSKNTSSTEEIISYKAEDPKYGYYADYIIITE